MALTGKVLVTGGTGYIGSHTSIALMEAGYEVVIIDDLSNSDEQVLDQIASITGRRPAFELADLSDRQACIRALAAHGDAVACIHFAALKAVGESVAHPLLYYRNNIYSLVNLLEALAGINFPAFVFSSSCTVYGQPELLPISESTPTQAPASPYGHTKQVAEAIIADTVRAGLLPRATALRYFNPIGAHESARIGELPKGVPNNLMPYITQTAAGIREQLKVYGADYPTADGTAVRDYIHVVDLAEAHVAALKRMLSGKQQQPYEVYNLGTGRGYSVLEVIASFERTSGEMLNYTLAERRKGDVAAIYADTALANEKLGWKARFDLDDMTRTAWAWEKRLRGLET